MCECYLCVWMNEFSKSKNLIFKIKLYLFIVRERVPKWRNTLCACVGCNAMQCNALQWTGVLVHASAVYIYLCATKLQSKNWATIHAKNDDYINIGFRFMLHLIDFHSYHRRIYSIFTLTFCFLLHIWCWLRFWFFASSTHTPPSALHTCGLWIAVFSLWTFPPNNPK